MSSFDRRGILRASGAAALWALAGCGYRPLYGGGESVRSILDRTSYSLPSGRLGFAMREALGRRLGSGADGGEYTLEANLIMEDSGLAITEDSSITRFLLEGRSRYSLTGPDGFAPLIGDVESVSAYSATGSLYATRTARRDAERRVASDLGVRIATAVAAQLNARGAA